MKKLYRHQFIWLSCPGYVTGWTLDELNKYINQYNREQIYKYGNFFDWLNWMTGNREYYIGFSAIWNENNPLLSKLAIIHQEE